MKKLDHALVARQDIGRWSSCTMTVGLIDMAQLGRVVKLARKGANSEADLMDIAALESLIAAAKLIKKL